MSRLASYSPGRTHLHLLEETDKTDDFRKPLAHPTE